MPDVRVSLYASSAPAPGWVRPPFAWGRLLDGPPPRQTEGTREYCLAAPETTAGGTRIENAIIFHASQGGLDEIEDRLYVTGRVLAGAIERERGSIGVPLQKAARRAGERSSPRVSRAIHGLADAVRSVTRGIATMPDRVLARAVRTRHFVSTREGRARLGRGLADPHVLHGEEKAVALFVGTGGLLVAILVAHMVVTLIVPQFASTSRDILALFGYAYVSSFGVPLPYEPALLVGASRVGAATTIVVAVAAKLAAAWMVFFVGDAVHDRILARAENSARWKRFLAWAERFAMRFGALAVALFIATPGLPDAIALYVFGALHMRMRNFLLGVALGAGALAALVVYGGAALFHLG